MTFRWARYACATATSSPVAHLVVSQDCVIRALLAGNGIKFETMKGGLQLLPPRTAFGLPPSGTARTLLAPCSRAMRTQQVPLRPQTAANVCSSLHRRSFHSTALTSFARSSSTFFASSYDDLLRKAQQKHHKSPSSSSSSEGKQTPSEWESFWQDLKAWFTFTLPQRYAGLIIFAGVAASVIYLNFFGRKRRLLEKQQQQQQQQVLSQKQQQMTDSGQLVVTLHKTNQR
ncbi:hypothetical protein QOT17_025217 [Balamuthia mandrillaris]